MARSPSDRGGRTPFGRVGLAATLLLLAALPWQPASVAEVGGVLRIEKHGTAVFNYRDLSLTLEDVVISHGSDTRVQARFARQTRQSGNRTQLDLSGGVQIDFRDAKLDAESAMMLFRGDQFLSVQVQGSQAQFSHQPEGYPYRVQGRADDIRFDTASGKVGFTGNTFYTDGCNELASSAITYDINEGTLTDDGDPATRGRAIICLDRDDARLPDVRDDVRIPAPRTPDRNTAP